MSVLTAYEWTLMTVAVGVGLLIVEMLLAARLPAWWFALGPRVVDDALELDGLSRFPSERGEATRSHLGRTMVTSEHSVLVTAPGRLPDLDLRTPFPMVGRVVRGDGLRLEGWFPLGGCVVLAGLTSWAVVLLILVKDDFWFLLGTAVAEACVAGLIVWGIRFEKRALLGAASTLVRSSTGAPAPIEAEGVRRLYQARVHRHAAQVRQLRWRVDGRCGSRDLPLG